MKRNGKIRERVFACLDSYSEAMNNEPENTLAYIDCPSGHISILISGGVPLACVWKNTHKPNWHKFNNIESLCESIAGEWLETKQK